MIKKMRINKINIDLDELSKGKVIVNGKDVSDRVSVISIVAHAGETPEITLKMRSGINAKINGRLKRLRRRMHD